MVLDASLLADNLHFIKTHEKKYKDASIREITAEISKSCDILYFSGRKVGFACGGGICIHEEEMYKQMCGFVPMSEGFLTYGVISVREMEAITVTLDETMDEDMIHQGLQFIEYMVDELYCRNIPVITPPGVGWALTLIRRGFSGCSLYFLECARNGAQNAFRAAR